MPAPEDDADEYPEWDNPQVDEDEADENQAQRAGSDMGDVVGDGTTTLAERQAAGIRESPLVSGSGTDGDFGELESVTDGASVKNSQNSSGTDDEDEDDEDSVAGRRKAQAADQTHEQRRWHSRTANMMKLLQRELPNEDDTVSYQSLAENRRRRTVAGCFFEVLQLKTCGRIDVQQDEAYGEISISQGPKFANAIL
jgi:cohesin complex subunit SCC1